MQKALLIASLSLWFCATAVAQKSASAPYAAELEPYIERFIKVQEIPGLAVAVVRDGKIVYIHTFGVRTVQPSVVPFVFPNGERVAGPVLFNSVFHLASISKTTVALAVMQLQSEGKIQLDKPVVTYLPEFELADPRYKQITVQQLLNHTSGLPDRNGIKGHGWDKPQTDDGALSRFVRSIKPESLKFAPGERFAYSNEGYEILGEIVATVSGMPFERYMQKKVLAPLGMKDSSFFLNAKRPGALVTGHETDDKEDPQSMSIYPFSRSQSPSGGMESSIEDMAKYAIANLNRGQLNGRRMLPDAAYDSLWRPAVKTGDDGSLEQYGDGWFVGTFEGHKIVSHPGKDLGFLSYIALLPEDHVGVVWMMNAGWADASMSISEAALDIALGKQVKPQDIRRDLPKVLAGDLDSGKDVAWVIEKYHALKTSKPQTFNFDEERLELLGNYLMDRHKFTDAAAIYNANAEAFPNSAHAFEKLGDAQLKAMNRREAAAAYRTALTLSPGDANLEAKLASCASVTASSPN